MHGFFMKFIMRYESETVKIMEAFAEHDFGLIWLAVVSCASDFKKTVQVSSFNKLCIVHKIHTTSHFRNYLSHKENAGQGLARNDGLDLAKGKYILFVDSDDYIETYTCERLVDVMEKEQADLCCFGYRSETPEGELFYQAKLKEKIYEGEQLKKQFVLHFFGDDQEEDVSAETD